MGGQQVGECGVAIGFVVGAISLGLEIVEQALGEVFFVFDENDQRRGGFSHEMLPPVEFVTVAVT